MRNRKPASEPTVLITGGVRRIGWSISQKCLSLGFNVIALHHHDNIQALRWLKNAPHYQGRLHFMQYNLAQDPATLITSVAEQWPALCGLVNNASIFTPSNLSDKDAFEHMLKINALAPLDLMRTFSEKVKKGWIINLTDARIQPLNKNYQNYRLSKLFLAECTRQMAFLLAPAIRVNAIAPGPVLKAFSSTSAEFKTMQKAAPLGFSGSVNEILAALEFFINSPSVTGETINIDGGYHLI